MRLTEAMEAEYGSWEIKGKKGCSLKGYGKMHTKRFPTTENVLLTLVRSAVCYGKDKLILATEDAQTLHAYNGRYFEAIDGSAEKFLKELIRRVFMGLNVGIVYQTAVATTIARECVETLTSSDEYLYVPDRRYIAFTNGVFDVQQGRLRPFDIRCRSYIALDIPYSPTDDLRIAYGKSFGASRDVNPAKLWDWKIAEIIPNKDMREAFQMFCGSLLADREQVRIEYVCYLIGSGSNGKSVLASAIAGVFGEKYFSRFTPRQLFKDSDARVNIAALQGKICNLVGDLEAKDIEGGGDFKRFASGEKFQGRKNYKDPIQVTAPPLLVCTNAMPETSDDSWGYHRRQLPIYTTRHQFTEEDKDPYLAQKLTMPESRSWIFNWIYEGYRKIQRNKGNIALGEDVVKAMQELQADSSSPRRWYRDMRYEAVENPTPKDPHWRLLREIYAEYRSYAEDCGYQEVKKQHHIGALLRSKNVAECRRSDGMYFCLGVKKEEE